jgi:hypothetical protein
MSEDDAAKMQGKTYSLLRALHEVHSGSDRATAIVGCALLDEALRRAICLRLLPETNTLDHLFAPRGGLSGIEAKIQMAFVLGIFNKETRDNLFALNTIRNRFAHKPEIHSFDSVTLGQLIDKLTLAHRRHAPEDIYGRANPDGIGRDASKRETVIFVIRRVLYYFVLDSMQPPRTHEQPPF